MKARHTIATVGAAAVVAAGGCVLALPASASSATHTMHFTAHTVSQASFGKKGGAAVDHDFNGAHKLIGYDVASFGKGNNGNVAVALKAGFLYAHLVFSNTGALTGTLTGGTGKYVGVTGTVVGTPISKKDTDITVMYKL
jgi:hypothetical protein